MDKVARQHDIDYLKTSGSRIGAIGADAKAIYNSLSSFTLQSYALRTGLLARSFLNIASLGLFGNFNNAITGFTDAETIRRGEQLQDIIDEESNFTGATGSW